MDSNKYIVDYLPLQLEIYYAEAVDLFNDNPKEAKNFLVKHRVCEGTAYDIAYFIYTHNKLSKRVIGEYLGGPEQFNQDVAECLFDMFSFTSMPLDRGIRILARNIRLPGEAQKIDRIMEKFALCYYKQNQGLANFTSSKDILYILSFSIIMLNTDLHNPSVQKKNKMTLDQFIRNHRGIDTNGADIDPKILTNIYNEIKRNPITMNEEDLYESSDSLFLGPKKAGWLAKQSCGPFIRSLRRWFVLKNRNLYYFLTPHDKIPKCIIPLSGIQITRLSRKEFVLSGENGINRLKIASIKSGKFVKNGTSLHGGISNNDFRDNLRLKAYSEADANEWYINLLGESEPINKLIEQIDGYSTVIRTPSSSANHLITSKMRNSNTSPSSVSKSMIQQASKFYSLRTSAPTSRILMPQDSSIIDLSLPDKPILHSAETLNAPNYFAICNITSDSNDRLPASSMLPNQLTNVCVNSNISQSSAAIIVEANTSIVSNVSNSSGNTKIFGGHHHQPNTVTFQQTEGSNVMFRYVERQISFNIDVVQSVHEAPCSSPSTIRRENLDEEFCAKNVYESWSNLHDVNDELTLNMPPNVSSGSVISIVPSSSSKKVSSNNPINLYLEGRSQMLQRAHFRNSRPENKRLTNSLQNSILSPLLQGWLLVRDCTEKFKYRSDAVWRKKYFVMCDNFDKDGVAVFYFPDYESVEEMKVTGNQRQQRFIRIQNSDYLCITRIVHGADGNSPVRGLSCAGPVSRIGGDRSSNVELPYSFLQSSVEKPIVCLQSLNKSGSIDIQTNQNSTFQVCKYNGENILSNAKTTNEATSSIIESDKWSTRLIALNDGHSLQEEKSFTSSHPKGGINSSHDDIVLKLMQQRQVLRSSRDSLFSDSTSDSVSSTQSDRFGLYESIDSKMSLGHLSRALVNLSSGILHLSSSSSSAPVTQSNHAKVTTSSILSDTVNSQSTSSTTHRFTSSQNINTATPMDDWAIPADSGGSSDYSRTRLLDEQVWKRVAITNPTAPRTSLTPFIRSFSPITISTHSMSSAQSNFWMKLDSSSLVDRRCYPMEEPNNEKSGTYGAPNTCPNEIKHPGEYQIRLGNNKDNICPFDMFLTHENPRTLKAWFDTLLNKIPVSVTK